MAGLLPRTVITFNFPGIAFQNSGRRHFVSGQFFVFFNRQRDNNGPTVFLYHYGFSPCSIEKQAKAVLNLPSLTLVHAIPLRAI
jgi:hypothetical protein